MKKTNSILKVPIVGLILFLIAFIAGTYFTFANGTSNLVWYDWVLWIDIMVGIIAAIALSNKYKYAWIILIIDALLYGSALFGQHIYATGVINMIIIPIILLSSLITWKGNIDSEKGELVTRKLSIKEGLFVSTIAIILTIGIGYLLAILTGTDGLLWRSWLDAFVSVITVFAFVFSVMRFRENWYLFLFANVVKIIMFSLLIALYPEENASPLSLILAITYFLNTLYGLWNWKDSKKESLLRNNTSNEVKNLEMEHLLEYFEKVHNSEEKLSDFLSKNEYQNIDENSYKDEEFITIYETDKETNSLLINEDKLINEMNESKNKINE